MNNDDFGSQRTKNRPFGLRDGAASAVTVQAPGTLSASTLELSPIIIEKNVGPDPKMVLGAILFSVVLTNFPLLFQRGAVTDALFHSASTYISLGLLVVAAAVCLFGRNTGKLEISKQGIRVATRAGRWFYAWRDIEGAKETNAGVQLLLKGRSDEQNAFNVITNRFGIKSPQFCAIIADATKRFGVGNNAFTTSTIAPADDLKATRVRVLKSILRIYAIVFGGLAGAILLWQVFDCLKDLELQKNGRPTNATVNRIYTADCGKNGCGLDVGYTYTPDPSPGFPKLAYQGYERIASSRHPNDPDLIYARTYQTVPIVYDAQRPKISALNFRNRIFARNPVSDALNLLFIMGAILGGVALLFLSALVPLILKIRRADN